MMPEPDVAILLTPPGSAAIAVVRLTGAQVDAFLRKHFSSAVDPERCVHGLLKDGERVIDDPVIVLHEDGWTADINLHGGAWVVRSMLELARASGFAVVERPRLPLPDEAVDADEPIEREILTHLPMARTEPALRVLLNQRQAWRDIEKKGTDMWRAMLAERSLHRLLHPPVVAIVGVANVGKSTLANQLFAQERSIVADLPGTTRDWVGEIADIDGLAVMLVDTPGHRQTDDGIEARAIEQSRGKIQSADLVVLVADPGQEVEPQQRLIEAHPEALIVVNKVDRSSPESVRNFAARISNPCRVSPPNTGWKPVPQVIETVAISGQGIDGLRRAIPNHFGCADLDLQRPRCWTTRQRTMIEQFLGVPGRGDPAPT